MTLEKSAWGIVRFGAGILGIYAAPVSGSDIENNVGNQYLKEAEGIANALQIRAEDVLRKLYPRNARGFFKNPANISKWDEFSLRVDFKLSLDVCGAVLAHDAAKVAELLLESGANDSDAIREILQECIKDMIDKFDQNDTLQMLASYLEVTGDQPYYVPINSMRAWLKSKGAWASVSNLAARLLPDDDSVKVSPRYELRASLYFDASGNSHIDVPSSTQMAMMVDLEDAWKQLKRLIEAKNQKLAPYKDQLESFEAKKRIEERRAAAMKEIQEKIDPLKREISEAQLEKQKLVEEVTKPLSENSNMGWEAWFQKNVSYKNSTSKPRGSSETYAALWNKVERYTALGNQIEEKSKQLNDLNAPIRALEDEWKKFEIDEKVKLKIEMINEECDGLIQGNLKHIKQIFETNYEEKPSGWRYVRPSEVQEEVSYGGRRQLPRSVLTDDRDGGVQKFHGSRSMIQ